MGMVPNIGWTGGAAKWGFGMGWAPWAGGAGWLLVAIAAATSIIGMSCVPEAGMATELTGVARAACHERKARTYIYFRSISHPNTYLLRFYLVEVFKLR